MDYSSYQGKEAKERPVKTYRALQRLWDPPGQALGSLAGILREHWQAARAQPERLFWSTPVSWLTCRAVVPLATRRAVSYQLTRGGRLIR
jgi:hypothetical protein